MIRTHACLLAVVVALAALCFAPTLLRAQDAPDEVAKLIAKLGDPKTEVRLETVQKLRESTADDRVIPPLLQMLKDPDLEVRKAAIDDLAEARDPRAIDPLLGMLEETNADIRARVITALGYIAGPKAVDPLLATLKQDAALRTTIIDALWRLGDNRAVAPLIELLKDKEPATSGAAAEALGYLSDDRAVEPLLAIARDEKSPIRAQAMNALGLLRETRVVDIALPLLQSPDAALRGDAIMALGYIGDARAVAPLVAMLKDPEMRETAVWVLGNYRDARAIDGLAPFAKEPVANSQIQVTALEALGNIRDPKAVPAVLEALKAKNDEMNRSYSTALEALGHIGDAAALETLLTMAASKDDDQCLKAVVALRPLADAKAIEVLTAAAAKQNETVRDEALLALAKIPDARAVKVVVTALQHESIFGGFGWQESDLVNVLVANPKLTVDDVVAMIQQDATTCQPEVICALAKSTLKDAKILKAAVGWMAKNSTSGFEVVSALKPYGTEAVDALLEALKTAEAKDSIMDALAQLGDARAVDPLIAQTHDEFFGGEAMKALAKMKVEKTYSQILDAAKNTNRDEANRWAALQALGFYKDKRATEVLLAALGEKTGENAATMRAIAAESLGLIADPKAADALIGALKDSDPTVSATAARALANYPPDARAIDPLLAMLSNLRNEDGRLSAVPVLAKSQDERITPAFIQAVHNGTLGDYEPTRRRLVEALGQRKDTHAVPTLIGCLADRDPGVRLNAAKALSALKDTRAVPGLMLAVKDEQPEVRTAAQDALKAITGQDLGASHDRWVAWWLEQHKDK